MTDQPKRPRDPNQLAKFIVDAVTESEPSPIEADTVKRARKAGLRGGAARAKALTPRQRTEIASIAAQARWKKSD